MDWRHLAIDIAGLDCEGFLAEWYMADLALLCRESGLRPAAGQCLSFIHPPVLICSLRADAVRRASTESDAVGHPSR